MSAGYLLPLTSCAGAETTLVGGKATGLGALCAAGLPVPPGFVVTTAAYRAALAERLPAIAEQLAAPGSAEANAKALRDLIETVVLPADLDDALRSAYAELGGGPVAVRSSATAEDADAASFAGQQDTHLWVDGADAVVRHVVACWASLFNAHAITYRQRVGLDSVDVAMAVVVQRMVDADAAGVALTLDPATGDRGTPTWKPHWVSARAWCAATCRSTGSGSPRRTARCARSTRPRTGRTATTPPTAGWRSARCRSGRPTTPR
jgi:pyruvate,water dikinase